MVQNCEFMIKNEMLIHSIGFINQQFGMLSLYFNTCVSKRVGVYYVIL